MLPLGASIDVVTDYKQLNTPHLTQQREGLVCFSDLTGPYKRVIVCFIYYCMFQTIWSAFKFVDTCTDTPSAINQQQVYNKSGKGRRPQKTDKQQSNRDRQWWRTPQSHSQGSHKERARIATFTGLRIKRRHQNLKHSSRGCLVPILKPGSIIPRWHCW